MTSNRLYSRHSRALAAEYANIETAASGMQEVFLGTAGGVSRQHRKAGTTYHVRKYRAWDGRQRMQYIGPAGDEEADAKAEVIRERVAEIKNLVPSLRMLGREGFNLVNAKSYATIAALHNHGVFGAGGLLVGSHAYGAILNKMGLRATPYATDDGDIARTTEALAFKKPPGKSLLGMLRETGVDFVAVPQLDHRKSPFRVDLLVPSPDETFPIIEVPELDAHATGLPYLKYLLAESQPVVLLAREGVCPVRVPVPERFAVHKIVVSTLRKGRAEKSDKDRRQGVTLAAATAEMFPGAIQDAVAAMSKRMAKHYNKALPAVRSLLEKATPLAWEELQRD